MRPLMGIYVRILVFSKLLIVTALLYGCSAQPSLRPLSANAVVLAYGDSLTYGTGTAQQYSYPAVLQTLSGHTVINGGVSGEVTADGLKRLPELLDEHLPELLILCHGGNDLLKKQPQEATANNIEAMILAAQQRNIQVVLLAVPKPGLLLELPEHYKAIAEKYNLPLEEGLLRELERNPKMKSDYVHFNRKGYAKMAEAIYTLLQDTGAL